MSGDRTRTIASVGAKLPATLCLRWSDGTQADVDLSDALRAKEFRGLRDPTTFAKVHVGDWGHSVRWDGGPELGADSLWLQTLSAAAKADAREFLDWRLRHGLSLSGAAEALGLSRRMIAYYSNGEKKVPRAILLACKGWEASKAA